MPVPKIPKSYQCNTGEQHEAYKKIDNFFKDTVDYIGIDITRPLPLQFEARLSMHKRQDNCQETDDFTHMLIYRPKQNPERAVPSERVVACVTEIRTQSNMMQFDFFNNLKDIIESENLPKKKKN